MTVIMHDDDLFKIGVRHDKEDVAHAMAEKRWKTGLRLLWGILTVVGASTLEHLISFFYQWARTGHIPT